VAAVNQDDVEPLLNGFVVQSAAKNYRRSATSPSRATGLSAVPTSARSSSAPGRGDCPCRVAPSFIETVLRHTIAACSEALSAHLDETVACVPEILKASKGMHSWLRSPGIQVDCQDALSLRGERRGQIRHEARLADAPLRLAMPVSAGSLWRTGGRAGFCVRPPFPEFPLKRIDFLSWSVRQRAVACRFPPGG